VGIPGTNGPTISNLANGFSYTDVRLAYTTTKADIGKGIVIQESIERPFREPAQMLVTGSTLTGSLTLPANSASSLSLVSEEVGNDNSAATAAPPIFATGAMGQTFPLASTATLGYQHTVANMDTELFQILTWGIGAPTAAGLVYTLELPGSADSTLAVPEPSSCALLGFGPLAAIGYRWRRRFRPTS